VVQLLEHARGIFELASVVQRYCIDVTELRRAWRELEGAPQVLERLWLVTAAHLGQAQRMLEWRALAADTEALLERRDDLGFATLLA
jgi:hypothetical protein